MPAPVTDAEKLIWGVIEAERPIFRCFYLQSFLLVSCVATALRRSHIYPVIFCSCSQLHGKSLLEANSSFFEKHKGDYYLEVV